MKDVSIFHRFFLLIFKWLRGLHKLGTTWKWRCLFGNLGRLSSVSGNIYVYHPHHIFVGDATRINHGVVLNAMADIYIGSRVRISPGCIINTGGLDYEHPASVRKHIALPVRIDDGVWLGSGVIVNPGVSIGKNTVVGAGAVVTKDLPPDSLAVGVPARVLRELSYD
ncbi:MAG: hypothetical protein A3J66_03085 [Candidatus Magasanikbacteria bacterium RIFCSPHIGHO2_02_FULL_47_14]|uniref:Acetyltransferase n=1 Tax=Candidatus Magasanikbacteria bacterium RIFCSPHIGHO2_02_FULL_47_14 TaxID=1798680 RepID=A0A1F6MA71_9BACT|nr:MAG: hypothetical protein A3J66_03085 [Candidatus Magasanikbacteria bacterium RIFCSPHIGHO2_02_FULL_47_14]